MSEDKIDKRTKEYKDSVKEPAGHSITGKDLIGAPVDTETIPSGPIIDPVLARLDGKLDKLLVLVGDILIFVTHPEDENFPDDENFDESATGPIDVTPPLKPVPIGDLTKCMKCGNDLPPTETPRRVQELCHTCVWRKSKKVS